MPFHIEEFYRINQRILIWAAILLLVWILRDFFALLFLTFLTVTFTLPAIDWLTRHSRLPRTLVVTVLYLLLVAGFAGLVAYTVPSVLSEATQVTDELHTLPAQVIVTRDDAAARLPRLRDILETWVTEERVRSGLDAFRARAVPILKESAFLAVAAIATVLLSLLFAFLIVLDLPRLTEEVRRMERSRLRDFFREGGEPVVEFLKVISASMRAQALMAFLNALLTAIAFLALGIPHVTLLTIVVFFFGFVPVLGAVISTVPAVLVAINDGGMDKALWLIVLVSVIHVVVAYVLSPVIYGRHLKVNPVIVLVVFVIGHHFFGIWGMLLGVPVYTYLVYYVLGVGGDGGESPKAEAAAESAADAAAPAPSR